MKKPRFPFFLKMFFKLNLLLIVSISYFPTKSDQHNWLEGKKRSINSKSKLTQNYDGKKLKNNLERAGFIRGGPNYTTNKPEYYATDTTLTVNKIFQMECPILYKNFSKERDKFISSYHNTSISIDKESIEKPIGDCFTKMYKKLNDLSQQFVRPIVKAYLNNLQQEDSSFAFRYEKEQQFIRDINSFSLNRMSENFKKIKTEINKYNKFEKICREIVYELKNHTSNDPISGVISLQNPKGGLVYDIINDSFTKWNQGFDGKSCKQWIKYFTEFTKKSPFTDFVSLPDQCKQQSGCVEEIQNKLDPPFLKKNENNLFNECHAEIEKAHTECFGDGKNNTELQQILSLVDQKSPAVCEQNKLARANQAKQNCNNAINQCIQSCHEKIKTFKQNFLQCFFLPDFDQNSYQALHKNTQCKNRIEELKAKFETQAKKDPFQVRAYPFETLSQSNDSESSIARHVIKACEDPLEKTDIDKKISELQVICQQSQNSPPAHQQNSQNGSLTGANGSNSSSNHSSDTAQGGVNSSAFSYGGTNDPFNYNGNQQAEGRSDSNSNFEYLTPPASSQASNPTSDKNSVSSDFEKNEAHDSTNPQNYSRLNPNSPTRRGTASKYGSSTGEDQTLKTEDETEETETIGEKISKGIRNFLSSNEQYGAIDDSYSSQSAPAGFLDWLNDKKEKAKKQLLSAYDGVVGISREEFQRRLSLNNESVNLFEIQKELLIESCKVHNCDKTGASAEVQNQLNQQFERQPSSQ